MSTVTPERMLFLARSLLAPNPKSGDLSEAAAALATAAGGVVASATTGALLAELALRTEHDRVSVPGSLADLCRFLLDPERGFGAGRLAERRVPLPTVGVIPGHSVSRAVVSAEDLAGEAGDVDRFEVYEIGKEDPVDRVEVTRRTWAPWDDAQVESLNGYQRSGVGHPFTCGRCRDADTESAITRFGDLPEPARPERLLVATRNGWVCPTCDYTQDWAWTVMANGGWRAAHDRLRQLGFITR